MPLSLKRICVLPLLVSLVFLTGCPPQRPTKEEIEKRRAAQKAILEKQAAQTPAPQPAARPQTRQTPAPPRPAPPARPPAPPRPAEPPVPQMTPVEQEVKTLVERFGIANNSYKSSPARAINELSINTNELELEDVELIAKLTGLEKLSFSSCRAFNDKYTEALLPLKDSLTSLKIGNSQITNRSAEIIAEFPNLVELNLERNTGIGTPACRFFANMEKLERLNLIYTSLNETGLLQIRRIPNLQSLDIRGCTIIADNGMKRIAEIPKLKSFQHYSNSVSDTGLEELTAAENIESLFLQDFRLTDAAGQSLKKFKNLTSLILFRCGEFGSPGLLELRGMPLTRLTLRGLPNLGNDGFEVFRELPGLKRLYLTELDAVGDAAFLPMTELKNLEILEVEIVGISDEALQSIAKLQNLRELKLRSVGITDAGLDEILKLPRLTSLTLLDNAGIDDAAARDKFAAKNYRVLEIGRSRGDVQE